MGFSDPACSSHYNCSVLDPRNPRTRPLCNYLWRLRLLLLPRALPGRVSIKRDSRCLPESHDLLLWHHLRRLSLDDLLSFRPAMGQESRRADVYRAQTRTLPLRLSYGHSSVVSWYPSVSDGFPPLLRRTFYEVFQPLQLLSRHSLRTRVFTVLHDHLAVSADILSTPTHAPRSSADSLGCR